MEVKAEEGDLQMKKIQETGNEGSDIKVSTTSTSSATTPAIEKDLKKAGSFFLKKIKISCLLFVFST